MPEIEEIVESSTIYEDPDGEDELPIGDGEVSIADGSEKLYLEEENKIEEDLARDVGLIAALRQRESALEKERNKSRQTLFDCQEESPKRYRMVRRVPASIHHCKDCDRSFKHPSKIKEHMRRHTGEKPFACHVCPARFTQHHPLKVHLRSHSGERPYKCAYCEKCFVSRSLCKGHEKVHMKMSPEVEMLLIDEESYGLPLLGESMQNNPLSTDQHAYICPINGCGFFHQDLATVERHIDRRHDDLLDIDNGETEQNFTELDESEVYEGENSMLSVGEEVVVAAEQDDTYDEVQMNQIKVEALNLSGERVGNTEVDPEFEVLDESDLYTNAETSNTVSMETFAEQDDAQEQEEASPSGGKTVVRMCVDSRRPRRGRAPKDDDMGFDGYPEIVLDPSFIEMAGPIKLENKNEKRKEIDKPPRNLDWIIEAVARGFDIDSASPHHRRKPTTWVCKICNRVIKYPSRIEAHQRMHSGEKPFKCEICGMSFAQKTPMRLHVRRHLDQRPYVCFVDGCGQRFVSGSILNHHQNQKHFNRKATFVCMRGCGRAFATSQNRQRHETICRFNVDDDHRYIHEYHDDDNQDYEDDEDEIPFLGEENHSSVTDTPDVVELVDTIENDFS